MMRFILTVMLGVFCSIPAANASAGMKQAPSSIEGRYVGEIKLYGERETIPLEMKLSLVDTFGQSANGEPSQALVGSFLIDGEGGPFAFSKVVLGVSDGRIDLKYRKPENNRLSHIPADFRFTGYLEADGVIRGEARSGRHGPVGSFQVKWTDQKHLQRRPKYIGVWKADRPVFGKDFHLVIEPSAWHSVNPQNYDFNYSTGKIGYFGRREFPFPVRRAYIDYIARTINFISNNSTQASSNLNLYTRILSNGDLEGTITSPYGNGNESFRLYKQH